MNGELGQIRSNLRTAAGSWEDEQMFTPAQEEMLRRANLQIESRPNQQNLEQLQRKHEELVERKRAERLPGQERWQGRENEDRRFVNILHPHRIFYLLRAAGVDARIESPYMTVWVPDKLGELKQQRVMHSATGRLWLNESSRLGRIGVNAWVRDEETGFPTARTVTTFQYPYGPEWSLFHFDQFGVATAEKYRGWRTGLLQMIVANVLTEEEVDRAFGPVVLNPASEFYRQQLQGNRRRRMGLQ